MGSLSSDWREKMLTEQFYAWELRGRGWHVFDSPVSPEPPFRPFDGHFLPNIPVVDDGRKQTFASSLLDKLRRKISPEPPPEVVSDVPEQDEPGPDYLERDESLELAISLPPNLPVPREAFEQFLFNLAHCRQSIAFELVGTHENITPQFAVHPADAPLIRRQLAAYFPEALLTPQERMLDEVWSRPAETAVVEFGLANEFMLPLMTGKMDLFIGLASALAELNPDEVGLYQVLFQPVRHPWAESILRAVTDDEGGSFFANRAELPPATKQKLSRPLYAAVVRIAAGSDNYTRAWEIIQEMAGPLCGLANPHGNELIPLHNDDYPIQSHAEDVSLRQSRRSGMLLNSDELLALFHLPCAAVQTSKLVRKRNTTKQLPKIVANAGGLVLGHNFHAGHSAEVRLTPEQRVRHTHIIGASGQGKSTLLTNLIRQDIENGDGVAVFDPHGDLIDSLLGIIPPHRVDDVILFDPSDEEYSIAFNILSAHSDLEKTLLASDLVSVFQRLSTSWGDQMSSVLHNAILAFLDSSRGGTLSDLRRFLLDVRYRNEFLKTVNDQEMVYYWQKGFPQLSGNKSIGPVLTRLETFLSPKPIRRMVSQPVNRLDFASIMDTGKIFLAKLPQGLIGRENAYLLGSLLVAKFQQAAMSRQRLDAKERNYFWLYVDEFHNFITPSMAEILAGTRKYRVGLILAHQELRQLQRDAEVASAVLSNCFTRVVFRVGDADARALAEGFTTFEARDLQNLEIGEAVCRVERSDFDFNLSIPFSGEQEDAQAGEMRERVIAASRSQHATPRAEVEEMLRKSFEVPSPEPEAKPDEQKTAVPPTVQERAVLEVKPVEKPLPKAEVKPSPTLQAPEEKKETKHPAEPRDLGQGGSQHGVIQQRLTQAAQELGFRAKIENNIPGSMRKIDLVLEKKGQSIACEINVESTIDEEVGNVSKCFKANYTRVAVICAKASRLSRLEETMKGCFSAEQFSGISFHSPDEFIAYLQTATIAEPPPEKLEPTEVLRRGYKVKRSFVDLSPEEAKAREASAFKTLAEQMRKKTDK